MLCGLPFVIEEDYARKRYTPRTGHSPAAMSGAIYGWSAEGRPRRARGKMTAFLNRVWKEQEGQDIAEYAVMLAVILVIVVGTVRLIGGNSNNVFSSVASSIGS